MNAPRTHKQTRTRKQIGFSEVKLYRFHKILRCRIAGEAARFADDKLEKLEQQKNDHRNR